MRLTTLILLTACMAASAGSGAQGISLNEKKVPLVKLLQEIKRQSGYDFFYNLKTLESAGTVSVNIKNASLQQALDACLKNTELTYTISDKVIVIARKERLSPAGGGGNDQRELTGVDVTPPIDIRGRVINEAGEPVAASILVKGTNQGTTTNNDGYFELKGVDENAVLVISGVSIETREVRVNNQRELVIAAVTKVSPLDQIQIIAYGQTTKRFQTGNVTSVKATDIQKQPVGNPLLALEGRVPGLFVTQASGISGAGVTMQIQGLNSINAGNDPLIVIDGIPFISQMPSTASAGVAILGYSNRSNYQLGGNGNPLNYVNIDDIESIEILKDADATSIYGSRAANGAILITTKKGKPGPIKVDLDLQQGWGKVARTMKMMNTQQYLKMRNEALANDGLVPNANYDYDLTLWDSTRYTDWVKTLIGGSAKYTNLNGSISGGNANVQYLIGSTFHRETSVFPGNFNDQKVGVHFNINSRSLNQKFRLQFSGSYLNDLNKLPSVDLANVAYTIAPNAPALFNSDGTLNWGTTITGNSSWTNPLAVTKNKYSNRTDNIISNAILGYQLSSDLELVSQFGYTKLQTDETNTASILSEKPEWRPYFTRSAQYTDNRVHTFSIEPQIGYKKSLGKIYLSGLVGATIQQSKTTGENMLGMGYLTDELLSDIRSASDVIVLSSLDANYKYNAIFGRASFRYSNRYMLNLNARRDGSSHFGPENRFNNFASIGLGWIFSDENIFKKNQSFLSFGKLRSSYGTTGNDQVGDYTYMDLYTATNYGAPYQGTAGLSVNGLSNPYLQWEETRKFSVGLDLGFFDNRILISSDFARNRSSNQLLSYALPSISGFEVVDRNFPALVQNISWEFSLNTVNVRAKNFEWRSNINLTIPKNKLLSFKNIETSSYSSSLAVGSPINVVKAYSFAGVNSATGTYQFNSANGSITSSPSSEDRTVLLDLNPKYYGGFQNSITYKQFQLDALIQFVNRLASSVAFGAVLMPGYKNFNQPEFLTDRWLKPGDETTFQKANTDFSLYQQWAMANQSNAGYGNASFLRLKNLSLAYLLPLRLKGKAHAASVKLFALAQNLFTVTKYQGADPETGASNTSPLRVITFGLHLGF